MILYLSAIDHHFASWVCFVPTVSGLQLWHCVSEGEDPEVSRGAWQERRASAAEPGTPGNRYDQDDAPQNWYATNCWGGPSHSSCLSAAVNLGHVVRNLSITSYQLCQSDAFPLSPPHLLHHGSFFRHGRRGGDDFLCRPDTFHHGPGLLLSGVCTQRGRPLSGV